MTPWQLIGGQWFKRDDLYAGAGGTSGAKLRACEHLIGEMKRRGTRHVVTAASVLSPQHAIVAAVAAGLDMTSHHIVGATNDRAMARHPSVAAALEAGGIFHHVRCAYNASLQPAARFRAEVMSRNGQPAEVLHYGITTAPDASGAEVADFLRVGAGAVDNIPTMIRTLVIPFGSGNTAAGILCGIDMCDLTHRVQVKLLRIGPDRTQWLYDRLSYVGVDASRFRLEFYDLTRRWSYADKVPYSILPSRANTDGRRIDLHPTYEGKCMTWLRDHQPSWWKADDTAAFWIVGGPLR